MLAAELGCALVSDVKEQSRYEVGQASRLAVGMGRLLRDGEAIERLRWCRSVRMIDQAAIGTLSSNLP